jgi:hypothetical protein
MSRARVALLTIAGAVIVLNSVSPHAQVVGNAQS